VEGLKGGKKAMVENNKNGFRVVYPSCGLCHGKEIINIQDIIKIKCPACFYEIYPLNETVILDLTLENAKRIRLGYPVKHTAEKWKALENNL
jgi:hypothetical protein